MIFLKVFLLCCVSFYSGSSLANEASSTSLKVPATSQWLKVDFMRVVSEIDKEKHPVLLNQSRELFLEKLDIEKEIGRLYYYKVVGSADEYETQRTVVKKMSAEVKKSTKLFKQAWDIPFGSIPYFGDYVISDISKFPKFYTAADLGLDSKGFKEFASRARLIFSTNIDLDKVFGEIYFAQFSGDDAKVPDVQKKLKDDRDVLDKKVAAFKKQFGTSVNGIPFFGEEDY